MQSHTSRLRREPANILHMVVEAAQLLVHRDRSGKVPRDDGFGAQHDEQMPERRVQIAVLPPSRRRTLTLEPVVIEKSLDRVLVNPIDVQPRPAHPKRKHCKACHVYIDSARCVPALGQMMPESISVGRQLARKKLVRRFLGKSSRRVHSDLLKSGDHLLTPAKLCLVQPSPISSETQPNRRSQVPRICALCIVRFYP